MTLRPSTDLGEYGTRRRRSVDRRGNTQGIFRFCLHWPRPDVRSTIGLADLEGLLRHLPFRSQGTRRIEPRGAGPRQSRRATAPFGKRCCASCAAARCRRRAGRGLTPPPTNALVKDIETERDHLAEVKPNPGRAHAPSPQPGRIRQRRSRSAGDRHRRCGAAAGGRHRLRLRQHRRRAERIALVAGALPRGGRQDQPRWPWAIPRCRRPIRPMTFRMGSLRSIG